MRHATWLRAVVLAWAGSRLLVVAGALVGRSLAEDGRIDTGLGADPSHLIGLLAAWDSRYYLSIGANGYPTRPADPDNGFFPFLPMIMRGLDGIGIDPAWGAVVLTNLVALVALAVVAQLTVDVFDDESLAARTAVLLAFAPGAIAMTMAYTEAWTIATGVGAALALARGRGLTALLLGLACGLLRPQGFMYAVPLIAIAWHQGRARRLWTASGPVIGLGAFMLYARAHTGDLLAYSHAQESNTWLRTNPGLTGLSASINRALRKLREGGPQWWEVRDVVWSLAAPLLAVIGWFRGVPLAWVIQALLVVVIPISAGGLGGVSRYAILAPAVFWPLAMLAGRGRWWYAGVLGTFVAMLTANAVWLPTHWP
jgi:hypothetical protein